MKHFQPVGLLVNWMIERGSFRTYSTIQITNNYLVKVNKVEMHHGSPSFLFPSIVMKIYKFKTGVKYQLHS